MHFKVVNCEPARSCQELSWKNGKKSAKQDEQAVLAATARGGSVPEPA